jgi:antitoxin ParD1/3/4
MPRSFALGEQLEAFVDAQVRSGRYNNASEVVRAGLRALEEQERGRDLELAELRRLVEAGRASGRGAPADAFLAQLESRYAAMAGGSDTGGSDD